MPVAFGMLAGPPGEVSRGAAFIGSHLSPIYNEARRARPRSVRPPPARVGHTGPSREGRMRISFHGQTDVGRRRPLNEDTIYAHEGLFLVCDGMGGHKAGEVASKLAAETVATFVKHSGEDPEL